MSRYEWLLFLHVVGAALIVGGAVAIAALQIAAIRRERPSEVALFLDLVRVPEVLVDVGAVMVLALGIWLALDLDYSLADGWIVASLVLWVVSVVLVTLGRRRYTDARGLARRLSGDEQGATPELRARLRDPAALALSWGGWIVVVTILSLMIFKPGAG